MLNTIKETAIHTQARMREGEAPTSTPMTLGELMDFYERHHVAYLRNAKGTSRRMRRYIAPLAALRLGELTRRQVIEWHHGIGQTRGYSAANLALQVLHAMYVKAQDWELYEGKNPAARVKKFPRSSRTRFVQPHELPWLLKSLEEEPYKVETYFLWLLLTGARRDEARLLKWEHLDLERALWHKPTSKTGTPHTVPIPSPLMARLQNLTKATPWVFPAGSSPKNNFCPGEWSVTAVEHAWGRIRKRIGLNDVRIHDLRRTSASWLACDGENISVIQRVLNHSSLAVTNTYARLTVEPVRRALENQAQRMLHPVVSLPRTATLQAAPEEESVEWPG